MHSGLDLTYSNCWCFPKILSKEDYCGVWSNRLKLSGRTDVAAVKAEEEGGQKYVRCSRRRRRRRRMSQGIIWIRHFHCCCRSCHCQCWRTGRNWCPSGCGQLKNMQETYLRFCAIYLEVYEEITHWKSLWMLILFLISKWVWVRAVPYAIILVVSCRLIQNAW